MLAPYPMNLYHIKNSKFGGNQLSKWGWITLFCKLHIEMFSLLFYYSCSIPMIGISISGNFFVFHSSIWWTLVRCWSSEHKIHLSIKCWKIQGYTKQQQPAYTKSWYSIAWVCNGFFAEAKLFHIFCRGILVI